MQDRNTSKGQFCVPVIVLDLDGNFNIAKALQACADSVSDVNINTSILMFVDADTVFENGSQLFTEIVCGIEKGKTYYCPIVSTEAKPTQWQSTFDGSVYIPDQDHLGTGLIAIHNIDYKACGGFHNSEFMNDRGEHWGQHDTFIDQKLQLCGLKPVRPVESRIWLRHHQRNTDTKWFSLNGSDHFMKTSNTHQ
jgi:hypothetical protein